MEDMKENSILDIRKFNFKLKISIFLNLIFTVVEIVAGIYGGSVSLIADGIHNLTDTGSLILTFFVRKIGLKPADKHNTFGYKRAEIMGAFVNIITLIISGIYLMYKSVEKIFHPEPIDGSFVIIIASIALIVDIISAWLIYEESKTDLNIKSAFLHSISDCLASVSVIVVGLLIMYFDLYIADIIATLLISAYMLVHGAKTSPAIIRILMGSVPENIDLNMVVSKLESTNNVNKVKNIFVWEIYQNYISVEAVIEVHNKEESLSTLQEIKDLLHKEFKINKSIIELN